MELIDILSYDKELFLEMVKKCNETYRSGHDLSSYLKIIEAHRRTRNITDLIEDDEFIRTIYETLKLWNMDQQGAELKSFNLIKESISACQEYLSDLYGLQLSKLTSTELTNMKETLFLLFRDLKIMKSNRRIVGVSKTMHFLLPDLIMPVDGKYTMTGIFGYNKLSDTATSEFDDMNYILRTYHRIAHKFNLTENDCNITGWNTSVPKLIDNAIIGLYKLTEVNSLEEVFTIIDNFINLNAEDKYSVRQLLDAHYKKLPIRQKAKKQILIEKAVRAGITVSDEEVMAEMAKRKKM